jgi:hypothetical protein
MAGVVGRVGMLGVGWGGALDRGRERKGSGTWVRGDFFSSVEIRMEMSGPEPK